MAADHVLQGRRGALVRHVHDVEVEDALEHLGVEMVDRAGTDRGEGQLSRLVARELDEIVHRFHRQLGIDHQHIGHAGDQRDGRDVLARIVRQVLPHIDIDRKRGARRHHDGVAVRCAMRDRVHRRHAAAARAMIDHERLAEPLLELLADDARDQSGRAARRERHDEGDGLTRILFRSFLRLSELWCREREQQAEQNGWSDRLHGVPSRFCLLRNATMRKPQRNPQLRPERCAATKRCRGPNGNGGRFRHADVQYR